MAHEFKGKTYWIVGASEGLGRSLAKKLSAAGASIVVSARSKDRLESLASEVSNASCVTMDVLSLASVKEAMEQIGEIDGIVYCAGDYEPMSALEWRTEKALKIADVNFMGAMRVLGEVMPHFDRKRAGHIVLIGSLAGFRGLPSAIGYGASKSALMHLAENIRVDTRGTDIQVQIINPGFIRTRLTAKNDFKMVGIQEPSEAAQNVFRAMLTGRFSTSFPAPFAWFFMLARYIPLSIFQRLVAKSS